MYRVRNRFWVWVEARVKGVWVKGKGGGFELLKFIQNDIDLYI